MLRLASVFYIDIAAFAVMSNHYHLVLHVSREDVLKAPPESIVRRALQLVRGDDAVQKYHNKEVLERWEMIV